MERRKLCVVVGAAGAGKTSLMRCLAGATFNRFETPTSGFKCISVPPARVYDLSGNLVFREMQRTCFKRWFPGHSLDTVIGVFDLSQTPCSAVLEDLTDWFAFARDHGAQSFILVGTKADLVDQPSERSRALVRVLKVQFPVVYFETSAKRRRGTQDFARALCHTDPPPEPQQSANCLACNLL